MNMFFLIRASVDYYYCYYYYYYYYYLLLIIIINYVSLFFIVFFFGGGGGCWGGSYAHRSLGPGVLKQRLGSKRVVWGSGFRV